MFAETTHWAEAGEEGRWEGLRFCDGGASHASNSPSRRTARSTWRLSSPEWSQ